jgi:hypothetical protein
MTTQRIWRGVSTYVTSRGSSMAVLVPVIHLFAGKHDAPG